MSCECRIGAGSKNPVSAPVKKNAVPVSPVLRANIETIVRTDGLNKKKSFPRVGRTVFRSNAKTATSPRANPMR